MLLKRAVTALRLQRLATRGRETKDFRMSERGKEAGRKYHTSHREPFPDVLPSFYRQGCELFAVIGIGSFLEPLRSKADRIHPPRSEAGSNPGVKILGRDTYRLSHSGAYTHAIAMATLVGVVQSGNVLGQLM